MNAAEKSVSTLIGIPTQRPTSWWLETLRKRAERMYDESLDLSKPVEFESEEERRACIKFFNAAYRAEESGKWKELTSAYVENLGRLFVNEPDLDFAPPRHLLAAFGMSRDGLRSTGGADAISVAAAEAAARREDVAVTPL